MTPAPTDTPPASPREIPDTTMEIASNEEELDINDDDIVEVIDLDGDDSGEADDQEIEGEGGGEASRLEFMPEDNSKLDFFKHNSKSVFCCSIHPAFPDVPLIATGGEDDQALVWNGLNGEIVFKCSGFKDSVDQVDFSFDGSYLAVADMSGVVKAWKVSSKEVVWEFETGDVTWLKWHSGANVLFASTEDSELWMWKIPSGESKIFSGHGEKAEKAQILPDGRKAIVGYADGTMRLFDLKTSEMVNNLTGISAHEGAITSLVSRDDNNLIASGSADGVAKLFNLHSNKTVGTFACAPKHSNESEDKEEGDEGKSLTTVSVEALVFSKSEQNFLVTGCLDGTVGVWDLSSHVCRQTFSVGTGIVKMAWRNGSHTEMLVATLDGLLRVVDIRDGKIMADCSGHTKAVLDFSLSKDGKYAVTCSDDGHSKVYDLSKIIG